MVTPAVTPSAGDLLVASVAISDGVFDQTVVVLLDHDDTGSLGVVVNRFSPIDLADVLPQWVDEVSAPRRLFHGGPMSPNGAICLASLAGSDTEPPGWRRLFHDVGLLHLDTPVEIVRGAFRDLRIFAGYAGWESRQLDAELARGAWHLVPARYDDLFGRDVETLWRKVLHRQGGPLAFFSTWVATPERN